MKFRSNHYSPNASLLHLCLRLSVAKGWLWELLKQTKHTVSFNGGYIALGVLMGWDISQQGKDPPASCCMYITHARMNFSLEFSF